MNPQKKTTIGILSDTHGLVRPEVEAALAGCDQILHAGDVGDARVLHRLRQIAPVVAVRGNMDYGSWSNSLPAKELVDIEGVLFYIMHDLNHLDLDPLSVGIHVVVSGHTHEPELFQKAGIYYLNPGSAGHRRHNHPISIARVQVADGKAMPQIIHIDR